MIDINLLPKQKEFITATEKFVLYAGGLGSGKTYALAIWIIIQAITQPFISGLIINNTYGQLRDTTLNTLFNLLIDFGIVFKYNSQNSILKINNSADIYCRSMDNSLALRGLEVGWIACDEAAFYREQDFHIAIGRLRATNCKLQCKLVSTPSGFNYLYKMFIENNNEKTKLIQSSSSANHYLPADYIATLRANYDSELAKQEIEGEFINVKGIKTYYAFDRKINVVNNIELTANIPIYIGMDFNVDPMTAVVVQYIDNRIYIVDEIFLRKSNTEAISNYIVTKYSSNCSIIPDSTGGSNKTNSSLSDLQILRNLGLHVAKTHNPHRRDRFNCVNNLLSKETLLISPKCANLIKDLEQYHEDTNDKLLGHISDALGYACWHFAPLQKPKSTNIINL